MNMLEINIGNKLINLLDKSAIQLKEKILNTF